MLALAVLLAVGLALILAWVLAWVAFHVVSGAIHLLLIVGAVLILAGLVRHFRGTGRATTGSR